MNRIAPSKLCGVVAAAFALALPSTPANAQSGPVYATSYGLTAAKSEAILGGSSALAAIMAKQQGLPAPVAIQPASLSVRTPSYAVLRNVSPRNAGVTSGRPDVFGSVAVDVGHTRLDDRWRRVARDGVGGAPAAYAASLANSDELKRIEAINRYVNRRVQFVDDSREYGRADLWAEANATLKRGRGDCEDYAIAKLQMLRAAGFANRDLYLVIVKDLVRRADHAVLVVRAAGRMLVLDNGSDVVADADTVSDYRPILTFSANGTWTHGYRRAPSTATLAEASNTQLAPAGPAGRAN